MAKFVTIVNGIPTLQNESSSTTIYDETFTVLAGGLTTGTDILLPNSETYDSDELEVYLNGQRIEETFDYSLVGVAPRTSIEFLFDLNEGEKVRFRKDRPA